MKIRNLVYVFVLFILLASPLAGVFVGTGGTPGEKDSEVRGDLPGGSSDGVEGEGEVDPIRSRSGGKDGVREGDDNVGHCEQDKLGGSWFDGFEDLDESRDSSGSRISVKSSRESGVEWKQDINIDNSNVIIDF